MTQQPDHKGMHAQLDAPAIFLLHFGELALKGKNRHMFERRLYENLGHALQGVDAKVLRQYGRFVVQPTQEAGFTNPDDVRARLQQVFGIQKIIQAHTVNGGYPEIEQFVFNMLGAADFTSFGVRAKRTDKRFPMNSGEMERTLGAAIATRLHKQVNLTNPDIWVHVLVTDEGNYVYTNAYPGAGGLPVRTGGRFLSLLSSGIDSPVASYHMLKRGAQLEYIHFHSYPMTDQASIENTTAIVRQLHKYQPPTQIHMVPLLPIQKAIAAHCKPSLRVLLYRRAMFQIAEQVAKQVSAKALVTGESLGQVASQTVENMAAVSHHTTLPIFRPLIGQDKIDITETAKRIGTFDISIQPYEDCCSLLTPKTAETAASAQILNDAQTLLDWDAEIAAILETIERVHIAPEV